MGKQVKGFLAMDGMFFEREPECKRHEAIQSLAVLCDSHGTNFENFLNVLNLWHTAIRGYYDADSKCKEPQVGKVEPQPGTFDDDGDDIPALLRTERDTANPASGEKDAPGFLEQQIRGHK
jgi:hypothetical protein